MTDKKTIREGAAVTENEAVEGLANSLHDTYWSGYKWEDALEFEKGLWRSVARTALTSHPAVEALRRLVEAMSEVWVDDETTEPEELRKYEDAHTHALAVLASLPKEIP